MDRELRRYQDKLYLSGSAVVVTGIWSAVRTLFIMIFDRKQIGSGLDAIYDKDPSIFIITMVIIWVIIIGEVSIRVIVGSVAKKISINADRCGYGFIQAFLLILIICSIGALIYSACYTNRGILVEIMYVFIELAAIYSLLEAYISSIKVGKINKRIKKNSN